MFTHFPLFPIVTLNTEQPQSLCVNIIANDSLVSSTWFICLTNVQILDSELNSCIISIGYCTKLYYNWYKKIIHVFQDTTMSSKKRPPFYFSNNSVKN